MTTRVSRNVPRLGTEDSSKEHVIGKKGKKPNVQKWSICRARFLLGATLKKMERNLRKHIIQHYLFLRDRFPKMALKQLITCPLVNKTFRRFEKKYCIHLGYHWVHHGGEDRPGFRWASNLPYSGAGPDSSGRRFNGKRGNRRGNRKASRGGNMAPTKTSLVFHKAFKKYLIDSFTLPSDSKIECRNGHILFIFTKNGELFTETVELANQYFGFN